MIEFSEIISINFSYVTPEIEIGKGGRKDMKEEKEKDIYSNQYRVEVDHKAGGHPSVLSIQINTSNLGNQADK